MNKKLIIAIIGLILCSVSVYAETKFYASDVSIDSPTGSNLGSNATLQDSLDELYSIADNNEKIETRIKSLETKTSKYLLYIDNFYGVHIRNGVIYPNKANNEIVGVVFRIPYGTTKITFTIKTETNNYVQYGMCDFNGTLPTIITTGANRSTEFYKTASTTGTYTLNFEGVAGNFFIGGYGFTLTDIYAS